MSSSAAETLPSSRRQHELSSALPSPPAASIARVNLCASQPATAICACRQFRGRRHLHNRRGVLLRDCRVVVREHFLREEVHAHTPMHATVRLTRGLRVAERALLSYLASIHAPCCECCFKVMPFFLLFSAKVCTRVYYSHVRAATTIDEEGK